MSPDQYFLASPTARGDTPGMEPHLDPDNPIVKTLAEGGWDVIFIGPHVEHGGGTVVIGGSIRVGAITPDQFGGWRFEPGGTEHSVGVRRTGVEQERTEPLKPATTSFVAMCMAWIHDNALPGVDSRGVWRGFGHERFDDAQAEALAHEHREAFVQEYTVA